MKFGILSVFLFFSLPLHAFSDCSVSMKETVAELGKADKVESYRNKELSYVTDWTFNKSHTLIQFMWSDGSEACQKITEHLSPPDGSYYNEPKGFRGVAWGTELKKMPGMKFVLKSDEGVKYYEKEEEVLSIGSVKLMSIDYGFWKNRLCTVFIKLKGSSQLGNIKSISPGKVR